MKIIKKISPKIWKWMEENPKKVFKYGIIMIGISIITTLIIETYYPSENKILLSPKIYKSTSSEYKKLVAEREQEMQEIVKELEYFRDKGKREEFTKQDSLRILFLNKKYNQIKNGNKKNNK